MVIRQTHGTCPYCNAVIKNYSLRAWFYGSPISTCKKCGNLYIDRRYHEMAVDGAAPDEFDVKKRNRQTSQSFVPRHNRFIGGQQPVKIVLNIQTVSTGSNCKGVYQRTCRCSILCVGKQPGFSFIVHIVIQQIMTLNVSEKDLIQMTYQVLWIMNYFSKQINICL